MLEQVNSGAYRRAAARLALVAAVGLALAACGGVETTVIEPPAQPIKVGAIAVQEGKPMVSCPPEVVTELRDKLTAKLYKPGGFGKGNTLKLAYRVVQYDGGDPSSRWSFDALRGANKGSLVVEAVYLDKGGKEVGKIRSEAKVGSSLLGHSIDDAVEHAANEVAEYTAKTFK